MCHTSDLARTKETCSFTEPKQLTNIFGRFGSNPNNLKQPKQLTTTETNQKDVLIRIPTSQAAAQNLVDRTD